MKRLAVLAIFFIYASAFSQQDAWIYFSNKPDSQDYLDHPLTMLTQRSLDRRTAQNIALDVQDVPVFQSYIDQVAAVEGISVMAKSKWLNAVHVRGAQSAVMTLAGFSFVSRIDFADQTLNQNGKPAKAQAAEKATRAMKADAVFNYGSSFNQIQMLNGHLLHEQGYTGAGKIIAVMDGGFPGVNTTAPFERLRANNQILGGYDYVRRNSNFYGGVSHGTLVLSTMGGFSDNQLVGTAPDASYYLFITEDGVNENPLEESLWVEAAEEADRLGADIISTSLGYFNFDNPSYNHNYQDMNGTTTFIAKGLEVAYSRGMICVVSAGNEGSRDWHYITTPADAQHALAVGAVNAQRNHAAFSSYGPSSDGRIKPDVAAQGVASVVSTENGLISTANGTSVSGPIIAGMVASFWQALPNKTNAEIMQLIKQFSSIYNHPNDEIGYGIPDFAEALSSVLGTKKAVGYEFLIYPNPAGNTIDIAFPEGFENGDLYVYNSIGQKVMQQEIDFFSHTVSVANLKSGIYLYQIQVKGIIQKGKLIKK